MVDKTGGEGRPSLQQQSRRRTTSSRQLDISDRSGSRRSIDPPEMKHSYKPKSSRGSSNNRGRNSSPTIDNSYRSNSTRETTITTQQSSSNTPNDTTTTNHHDTNTTNTTTKVTNIITKLPQLISITIYKQSPTQPAGLKLISNNSNSNSGVIISNISSTSPFHPTNFTNSLSSSNVVGLVPNDELLLVNNHRVRHPSKAVQIIKNSIDKLNVVVSRGKRIDGMTFCLVRFDNNNDDDIEDNNKVNRARDVHRGDASAGGESCSIASSSIKSRSKWQELKDSPSSTNMRISHGLTFYQSNNLIHITNISSTSSFYKSNLQKGDILLSINGQSVQSINDVVTLLNGDSSLGLDSGGGDGDSNPYIKNDNKKEDRVVILLIYSIWKLRHRVLNDELQLVQDENDKNVKRSDVGSCKSSNSRSSKNSKVTGSKSSAKDSSDKQVWQAIYSYQEEDQSTPIQQPHNSLTNDNVNKEEEYIILRIP